MFVIFDFSRLGGGGGGGGQLFNTSQNSAIYYKFQTYGTVLGHREYGPRFTATALLIILLEGALFYITACC